MVETTAMGLEPRRRGRTKTRARILAAAIEAFARDGFDQTSFRGIAEQCGLTDAALYYYYPSKRALLDALWDIPRANALQALASPELGPQGLLALVDVMLDVVAAQDALIRLLIRGVLDGDATALALRNQTMAYWRRLFLPHFERSFAREDAILRLDAFLMLILGITLQSQTAHLGDFPRLCHEKAYRDHIMHLMRTTVLDTGNAAVPAQ